MECRKCQTKERNIQKKNIQKLRERKIKNARKVKQKQYTSLVLNYIMLENIIWKKVVYTIKFYVQFSCVAGYLKHSNDNVHNSNDIYRNYTTIEIYINKLSTRKQIFIAMDCLIMMSEKYIYFRKRKKTFGKDISYPLHRSNWIHVLWKYFSNYVFSKDIYKNLFWFTFFFLEERW